jgi:hypothetical protein
MFVVGTYVMAPFPIVVFGSVSSRNPMIHAILLFVFSMPDTCVLCVCEWGVLEHVGATF